MIRMCGEIAVIEAAAVAAAPSLRVKCQTGHQNERRLIPGNGAVRDRLRHTVIAGGHGVEIIQPQKPHFRPEPLRDGDALTVLLRLPEHGNGAHLLIERQIAVN